MSGGPKNAGICVKNLPVDKTANTSTGKGQLASTLLVLSASTYYFY